MHLLALEDIDIQSFEIFHNDRNMMDIKISHKSACRVYQTKLHIINIETKFVVLITDAALNVNKRNIARNDTINQDCYTKMQFTPLSVW